MFCNITKNESEIFYDSIQKLIIFVLNDKSQKINYLMKVLTK